MRGTAEMIFSGDELLRGDTTNTNQAYLGRRLLELGLFATHALTVTDEQSAIVQVIRASIGRRPDVLVLSGGLGPTNDDLTREAVSEALDRPLVFHEELLRKIQAFFDLLNMPMVRSNDKQAFLPDGAIPIPFIGTAPGFWLLESDTLVVALPGVPRELKHMWTETVEPLLRHRLREGPNDKAPGVLVRQLRVYGMGESSMAEVLGGLPWRGSGVHIGTRAGLHGVTLILKAEPSVSARIQLAKLEEQVRELLGNRIYGADDDDMAAVVGNLLRTQGLTLATAESCTGGLVAKRLTDIAGSSDYFRGGVIAYSNEIKSSILGVDLSVIEQHGAVSEEVAAAMALGARRSLGSACAISVTGIAGPGGGTPQKPVGLVYIATTLADLVEVRRFTLFQSRDEIRERAAQTALDVLRRRLLGDKESTQIGA